MLLNYDFLEFENDKKVRVIDDKLHVNILDFFGIGDEDDKIFLGDEISNIKDNPTEAYAAEVYAIEGAKLNRVYEKIRSGLPFGIISERLDLLKDPLQRILLIKNRKSL
ncbi:hypothetical protein BD0109_08450 [Helicobacter pylori]